MADEGDPELAGLTRCGDVRRAIGRVGQESGASATHVLDGTSEASIAEQLDAKDFNSRLPESESRLSVPRRGAQVPGADDALVAAGVCRSRVKLVDSNVQPFGWARSTSSAGAETLLVPLDSSESC